MKDTAPSRIKTHIDTLVEDVDLYTNYLLCPWIPKTNNHVEEYYRQTDPRKIKKRYKTIPGLTRALQLKAIYWIVKHGLILEDESLRLSETIPKQTLQQNQYLHSIFWKRKCMFSPTGYMTLQKRVKKNSCRFYFLKKV